MVEPVPKTNHKVKLHKCLCPCRGIFNPSSLLASRPLSLHPHAPPPPPFPLPMSSSSSVPHPRRRSHSSPHHPPRSGLHGLRRCLDPPRPPWFAPTPADHCRAVGSFSRGPRISGCRSMHGPAAGPPSTISRDVACCVAHCRHPGATATVPAGGLDDPGSLALGRRCWSWTAAAWRWTAPMVQGLATASATASRRESHELTTSSGPPQALAFSISDIDTDHHRLSRHHQHTR
jgi:hypothetical protein